jgi:ABC-2 type transport system permease protein
MLTFFTYRLKALAKQKALVFWALMFPIILVTFFNFALSNLDTAAIFKPFDIAIVGPEDSNVVNTLNQVEMNGEKLFKLKFVTEDEAKKLLDDEKVEGIVMVETDGQTEDITLGVDSDGFNQILLKQLLDSYSQKYSMIAESVQENPDIVTNGVLDQIDFSKDYIKHIPVSEKSNNTILISYYSAIAMACLYGAFISAHSVETLQANQTPAGQRLSVSPYLKSKMLGIDFVCCFILILLCALLMMLYMRYVIGVAFSNQFGSMLFIAAIGALVSTAFGYFISLLLKRKTNAKLSIIVSITMLWSAMAGMMSTSVKYYIEVHVPYINWINPVALITDSFTSLYYYGDMSRAWDNIVILAVLFVLLMTFSVIKLRRQQYESL